MIDIGTRKHGPFDSRYPRPRTRGSNLHLERSVDRESLDTWEGEGGQADARTRAGGRGNGLRLSASEVLADGLSWKRFCALTYPGMKRHYFAAIAAWYRYRDGDRSRPG